MARIPLAAVAERDLVEDHAVELTAAANVEMTVHDGLRSKAEVPVLRTPRPAPDREARYQRQNRVVAPERKMVHEDRAHVFGQRGEPGLGHPHASIAPRSTARMGIGMQ